MTMNNPKCYVGIDVASEKLDIYISTSGKVMQFKNNNEGFKKLISKFSSCDNVLIAMEATGGYETNLAQALAKANFQVAVINPRRVRDFAKALGKIAKTDLIDAKIIATFAEKTEVSANVTHNPKQREINQNNARRRQILEMLNGEKNRLQQAQTQDVKKSIKAIIKALEKSLAEIEKTQKDNIENNEQYAKKHALLTSIPGIATITATSLISDLPELGELENKPIAALAGLAPFNRDSGTFKGQRSIWGGRAPVRTSLYMATLVATRHNEQIKQFYERLCNAGKAKKVALLACMRKLLTIMNAMIKNSQPWKKMEMAAV